LRSSVDEHEVAVAGSEDEGRRERLTVQLRHGDVLLCVGAPLLRLCVPFAVTRAS